MYALSLKIIDRSIIFQVTRGFEMSTKIPERESAERPAGYQEPSLSPTGLEHIPHTFARGVHALMANMPPKDNNGLIVGSRAALLIDAGFTPQVARRLQAQVAELSDVPLRYLVNTTYHGDHTFGNASYPEEVTVVSSRANRDNMTDLAREKQIRSGHLPGEEALLDEVRSWRLPDVTFDERAEIDLGGRIVQLWQFGPGNGPGDTVVYVPDVGVAWTGNYITHAGVAPMLLQGGPEPYLQSLRKMRQTLPGLRTVVPGHGPMGDGPAAIDFLTTYFSRLLEEMAQLRDLEVEEAIAATTNPWDQGLDPSLSAALAAYGLPAGRAEKSMLEICRNLHRLNALATYRALYG
ncbi:MBL fold metallo-hydrolase [Nonomuraea composti]|nr:MBL fold metallo-hydrolase [Nonomuraea sp. FMUSA5-5]